MSKGLIFFFGMAVGTFVGICLANAGISNNSGSEFWGDKYVDAVKDSGKGISNNCGSKFYSDLYIEKRFGNTETGSCDTAYET